MQDAVQGACFAHASFTAGAALTNALSRVTFPLARVFLVGVSHALGHAKACQWIMECFLEAQEYRRMFKPTQVMGDILDPHDPIEANRVAPSKACPP